MKKTFLTVLALCLLTLPAFAADKEKESAYDRVMRTQTLRCGYGVWPTYLEIDPNTGVMSGIWYEYVQNIGNLLGIKIEWVAEVPFGDINAAIRSHRIDAFCSGLWLDVTQAKDIDYTIPITYQAVVPVVRQNDHRFDTDISMIDNPKTKVSAIDGDMSALVRESNFPHSTLVGLPSLTDPAQMLLNVASGKADVTFTSPETVMRFLENNPGSLKSLRTDRPLRLFAEVIAVGSKEHELRRLLDHATSELLNRGTVEKIVKKYEKYPNSFYRVAKPYAIPE